MNFENSQNKKETQDVVQEKKQETREGLEIFNVIDDNRQELFNITKEFNSENKQIISDIEDYPASDSSDINLIKEVVDNFDGEVNEIIKKTEENVENITGSNENFIDASENLSPELKSELNKLKFLKKEKIRLQKRHDDLEEEYRKNFQIVSKKELSWYESEIRSTYDKLDNVRYDIPMIEKRIEELKNYSVKSPEQEKPGEKNIEQKQEGLSQDDLRGKNIVKRVGSKFSGAESGEEFLNISKKITEKIKDLPDNIKEIYWQKILNLVKSEQNNDIYFYKELHDNVLDAIKLSQKNTELKNQEISIENRVSKCSSFEDIDTLLNSVDKISGSENDFSSEDLKRIVRDVRSFKAPLNALTRSAGLRDKVKSLISKPDPGISIFNKHVQTANGLETWQTQNTPNPEIIRFNQGKGWELVDKSKYKELLRGVKEERIGESVNLWSRYNNELFELGNVDSVKRNQLGEQMNLIRNSLHNELILQQNSLDEIKENLEILYKKTNTVIYKNLLDYANSRKDVFAGNRESPLFKKILSLKK